jgi:hypothetical protein
MLKINKFISFPGTAMTSDQLYGELEGLVLRLGIELRDDPLEEAAGGGLCVLNGKRVILLDPRLGWEQKNRVLLAALKTVNVETVYIKPLIRRMIEGSD